MGKGKAWTAEEDEVIRKYFPVHGPGWPGFLDLLPGRSYDSIITRRKKLGIPGIRETRRAARKRPTVGTGRKYQRPFREPATGADPLRVEVPPEAGDWDDAQIGQLVDAVGSMAATGPTLDECVAVIRSMVRAYSEDRE